MAKPTLAEPFRALENELIGALLDGLREWRPDLAYPQSHSDMQAAVRGLLQRYDVIMLPERRELPLEKP